MQIEKIMVLSTAHIKKETADLLEEDNIGLIVISRETGYLIHTVSLPMTDSVSEDLLNNSRYPNDLAACIQLAHKNGCDWLLLDCDGPIESDIPFYDW